MNTKQISIALSGALFAAAAAFAPSASAACRECGTVTEVKTVEKKGEGSGLGMVIGGVAGGVLGHQVGSGRGKDVATVAGAAGGAYVGNEVEKNKKSTTTYVVYVKMEDGSNRTFNFSGPTNYRAGDRVKVIDKKLTRQ
jgi:outer membrane lipoprotein SlyB